MIQGIGSAAATTPSDEQSFARTMLALQAKVAAAHGDIGLVMTAVVDAALAIVPRADGAVIATPMGADLVYRAASGSCAGLTDVRLPLAASIADEVMRACETLYCPDGKHDPRFDALYHHSASRSIVVVPVPFRDGHAGVLKLCSLAAFAFTDEDLLAFQLLAGPLAVGFSWSAHSEAAHATQIADRRFAATFEQAAVGMAHVAPDGRFLLVNRRFCDIVGYSPAELVAGGFQQITHPDDLEADLYHVEDLIANRAASYAMEKRYIRRDASSVWINLTVSLVRSTDGAPEFFVSVIEDISARKQAEQAARHDSLTGLLNRRGLLEEMDALIAGETGEHAAFAVIFLDLDGFKRINDHFGHAEGDRCLVAVADALTILLHRGDRLARLGGDEFVLLTSQADEGEIALVTERARMAVSSVATPGGALSVSLGAVGVTAKSRRSATEIIAAADRLMYDAKHGATEASGTDWYRQF